MAEDGVEQRKQGWLQAFQSPQMQTMLMQFGISALQPQMPGVGGAAHFANSLGAAGEAANRQMVNTQQQDALRVQQEQQDRQLGQADRGLDVAADRNTVAREDIGSRETLTREQIGSAERQGNLTRQTQMDIAQLNKDVQYAIAHMGEAGADRRLAAQHAHATEMARAQLEAQGLPFHPTVLNELIKAESDQAMLGDRPFDLARPIGNYNTVVRGVTGQGGAQLPGLGEFSRAQFGQLYSNPNDRATLEQIYGPDAVSALARTYGVATPDAVVGAAPALPEQLSTPEPAAPDPRNEQFRAAVDSGIGAVKFAFSSLFSGTDNLELLSPSDWNEKLSQVNQIVATMPEGPRKQQAQSWISRLDRIPIEDRAIYAKRIEQLIEQGMAQ